MKNLNTIKKVVTAVVITFFIAVAGSSLYAAFPPAQESQGGTGWNDIQEGSLIFGNSGSLRLSTSTDLQFNNTTGELQVTNYDATNGTTTNATSTSFFATTASSTNTYIGNLFSLFGAVSTSITEFVADLEADIETAIDTLNNLTAVGTLNSGAISSGFGNIDIGSSNLDADGTVTFGGLSDGLVRATTGALSGGATVAAGEYGAASIDGDDINSNVAGRSLTLTSASPDTLDIDAEIYTFSVAANMHATTTADGIATTTEDFLSVKIPIASTITALDCYADDTGTSTVKTSYASNPLSSGTVVVTAGSTCGSDVLTNTTSFDNSSVSAGDWLRVWVSDAEPTGARPRVIYFTLTLTKND